MTHITLNTGHSRHSPRSEVSDAALSAVSALLHDSDTHGTMPLSTADQDAPDESWCAARIDVRVALQPDVVDWVAWAWLADSDE